jgi:hypothetical protein
MKPIFLSKIQEIYYRSKNINHIIYGKHEYKQNVKKGGKQNVLRFTENI